MILDKATSLNKSERRSENEVEPILLFVTSKKRERNPEFAQLAAA